jgi:hypothetical protein
LGDKQTKSGIYYDTDSKRYLLADCSLVTKSFMPEPTGINDDTYVVMPIALTSASGNRDFYYKYGYFRCMHERTKTEENTEENTAWLLLGQSSQD